MPSSSKNFIDSCTPITSPRPAHRALGRSHTVLVYIARHPNTSTCRLSAPAASGRTTTGHPPELPTALRALGRPASFPHPSCSARRRPRDRQLERPNLVVRRLLWAPPRDRSVRMPGFSVFGQMSSSRAVIGLNVPDRTSTAPSAGSSRSPSSSPIARSSRSSPRPSRSIQRPPPTASSPIATPSARSCSHPDPHDRQGNRDRRNLLTPRSNRPVGRVGPELDR